MTEVNGGCGGKGGGEGSVGKDRSRGGAWTAQQPLRVAVGV